MEECGGKAGGAEQIIIIIIIIITYIYIYFSICVCILNTHPQCCDPSHHMSFTSSVACSRFSATFPLPA